MYVLIYIFKNLETKQDQDQLPVKQWPDFNTLPSVPQWYLLLIATESEENKSQYHAMKCQHVERVNGNVEFYDDDSIFIIPKLNDEDKLLLWYNQDEFDRFKTEAARDAGVEIFQPNDDFSSLSSDEQACGQNVVVKDYSKFVMVGDFDCSDDGSAKSDAATCSTRRTCTNEYTDTVTSEGEQVCKRGLGFHFSQYRKRYKAFVRSSVLSWYKSMTSLLLEKDAKRDALPIDIVRELDKERREKSILMLAHLYSKCSKDEKEYALWRGKMDYQMAYPENSCKSFPCVAPRESLGSMKSAKKRAVDEIIHQANKRRLTCTDSWWHVSEPCAQYQLMTWTDIS